MPRLTPIHCFAVFLATLASVACGAILNAEPTPTPTPYDVNRIYGYLYDLKESNIAELRDMEHRWQVRFRGTVHRIDERKIRFNVDLPEASWHEQYVECNFRSNSDMVSMREGDDVTVQGELVRALRDRFLNIGGEHGAIVFEDCRLVEIHGRRSAN